MQSAPYQPLLSLAMQLVLAMQQALRCAADVAAAGPAFAIHANTSACNSLLHEGGKAPWVGTVERRSRDAGHGPAVHDPRAPWPNPLLPSASMVAHVFALQCCVEMARGISRAAYRRHTEADLATPLSINMPVRSRLCAKRARHSLASPC